MLYLKIPWSHEATAMWPKGFQWNDLNYETCVNSDLYHSMMLFGLALCF